MMQPSGVSKSEVSTVDDRAESPGQWSADEEVAAALAMLQRGAPDGMERLIPLVYSELRRIAHRQLAGERAGHTLSTTDLVHEAYLRLSRETRSEWTSRAQFYAIAARVMRRVLVDYARRRGAARRGGPGRRSIALEDAEFLADAEARAVATVGEELVALDEALERLTAVDARLGQVVECRFFGGLTESETAEALGVSRRTVASDWVMAKGWLYRALSTEE
jgi:RNA polymerase sigma factor (TIGR02999 family)